MNVEQTKCNNGNRECEAAGTVAIMKTEKLCHRQMNDTSGKVLDETKRDTGEWKKYGDLYVRCTYGKEDLTELLISYAKGLASTVY